MTGVIKWRDENGVWHEIPALRGGDGFSPVVTVDKIDGGHRVTITDAAGAKGFEVMDGAEGASFDAAAHGIPVLRLTGDTTGMSKETSVEMSFVMGERSGACTLKWQGTSSIYYPKKNYTIRFDEAFRAKSGWSVQSKYCLKAYWVDASYLRDLLGASIWHLFVGYRDAVPEQLAVLPKSGAVDGFPVWVTINGKDQGLYMFNIPKDAWMFGMTGANAGEAIISSYNSDFSTPAVCDGTDFTIEYAASEDTSGVIASFNRLITAVNSVKSADDLPALEEVLDIESAIDYYILAVAIRHYDGIVKNGLFVTFDGTKWIMSAYDMDATFGNKYDGSGYGWSSDWPSFTDLGDNHKLLGVLRTYYGERIKAKFKQLRGWALNDDGMQGEAYKLAVKIPKPVLDEDYRLWPGRPGTLTNNIEQILSYTRLRMVKMDYNVTLLT